MASNNDTSPLIGEIKPKRFIMPDYSMIHKPLVAFGSRGDERGELNGARGVAFREETQEIFVIDEKNSRIQIYNNKGDPVCEFGEEDLEKPSSLLIHDQFLFVTDWGWLNYSLLKYDITSLKILKKIGKNSFDSLNDYNLLRQPTIGPKDNLYIPDNNNDRICIFTTHLLEQVAVFRYEGMTSPVDIKFQNEKIFVLNTRTAYCVHIFTLDGNKIESIITRDEHDIGKQVLFPSYFLIDSDQNILISDFLDHSLKVFTPSGNTLSYRFGGEGNELGRFVSPMGVIITQAGRLIVTSGNERFGVQIF